MPVTVIMHSYMSQAISFRFKMVLEKTNKKPQQIWWKKVNGELKILGTITGEIKWVRVPVCSVTLQSHWSVLGLPELGPAPGCFKALLKMCGSIPPYK